MKHKSIITTISVVALISLSILVSASVGCTWTSGEATDMMEMIPEDIHNFYFIDVEAIRGDDNLEDYYEDLEDASNYLWLEKLDINLDDVDGIGIAMGKNIMLLYGEFDLDDVREELDDLNFNDDEYKGIELWESDEGNTWIALMDDTIIIGNEESVKDCIRVIEGGEDSMLDDNDCEDIMDRMPSGIFMMYNTVEEYQDLEASGISIQTKDEDTLKITEIFKFEDEDAAEDAVDKIEEYADEEDYYNVNIDQDGEFVEVTAEVDIGDYPLAW